MTRNLKALLASAMALAALGVLGVSGAQAAEFHCDPTAGTTSCFFKLKPDGTATTAHHVFVVKNAIGETASFTCNELDGSGTASKTASSVTASIKLEYTTCKLAGRKVKVRMNSCDYNFTAAGTVTIANCGTELKPIEIETEPEVGEEIKRCIVTVGNQGPLNGILYHNIGSTGANTTEVTGEAKVPGITATVDNPTSGCFGTNSPPYTAEYTTGNTLGTAESDPGNAMVPGWWA